MLLKPLVTMPKLHALLAPAHVMSVLDEIVVAADQVRYVYREACPEQGLVDFFTEHMPLKHDEVSLTAETEEPYRHRIWQRNSTALVQLYTYPEQPGCGFTVVRAR